MLNNLDLTLTGKLKMKGLKIMLSGRIMGIDRAKIKKWAIGPQNQQLSTSYIDLNISDIYTKNGILGLKIERSLGIMSVLLKHRLKYRLSN
jgi:ribosomal protein S3